MGELASCWYICVKIKATGDSKFNDSPEYSHFVEQRMINGAELYVT